MKMRKIISLFAALTVVASFASTMTVAHAGSAAPDLTLTANVVDVEELADDSAFAAARPGYHRYAVSYALEGEDLADLNDAYGLAAVQIAYTPSDESVVNADYTWTQKIKGKATATGALVDYNTDFTLQTFSKGYIAMTSTDGVYLEDNTLVSTLWQVAEGEKVDVAWNSPTAVLKLIFANWENPADQITYTLEAGNLTAEGFTVGSAAPDPKEFTWNYGADTAKAGYKVEGQGFVWKQINVENASLAVNAQGVLTSGGESYSRALNFGEIDNGSFTVGVVSDKDAMDFEIVTDED